MEIPYRVGDTLERQLSYHHVPRKGPEATQIVGYHSLSIPTTRPTKKQLQERPRAVAGKLQLPGYLNRVLSQYTCAVMFTPFLQVMKRLFSNFQSPNLNV